MKLPIEKSVTANLPMGSAADSLDSPHFPNRLFALIWRNWELVVPARLAEVVGTTTENIVSIATSMGLTVNAEVSPEWNARGYITLIRRNWHLLPYEQLLILLDKSSEELAFYLREDDALFLKLGNLKPRCSPIQFVEPTDCEWERAAQIKVTVQRYFGRQLVEPAEPRFDFVKQLSAAHEKANAPQEFELNPDNPLRVIYSYFGGFADSLSDPSADPYPDGLLARFAELGINGVWLHGILRLLAPGGELFPEFGQGWQVRLENLRQLTSRAASHGIGVYLYLNEPRAMPSSFFATRPELAGVSEGELTAMCSSQSSVREWMSNSLCHVFTEVPLLAGAFTITASESLTNCACRFRQNECPRCKSRSSSEIIAEVNTSIADGIHRGNARARVIAWDWGWNQNADPNVVEQSMTLNWGGESTDQANSPHKLDWVFGGHGIATDTIERLPVDIQLMSVSEWATPINRGGIAATINEYSLSEVGPGPRAKLHWKTAREIGLKQIARVQANNSWELASVPYLPVLDLVAEKFANLAAADIDGIVMSWTLGGYPSLNLRVAQEIACNTRTDIDSVLQTIAIEQYGSKAAPFVRLAWSKFSKAFQEFPFDISVLYNGPQHMGPANLFFEKPTNYQATMVGLPYDDLENWQGPYPAQILAEQFAKVANDWLGGISDLRRAIDICDCREVNGLQKDLGVAIAAHNHFASACNQVRYIITRDALQAHSDGVPTEAELDERLVEILNSEIKLSVELHELSRRDSRLGFEPSNHYFYVPGDLVEKVINCVSLLERIDSSR